MSSGRNNSTVPGRTYRPALASNKSLNQSPLTPRLAATATSKSSTPRIRQPQDASDIDAALSSDNVTPRSAKRMSRVESSNNTPTPSLDTPIIPRANTVSPLSLAGSTPSLNGLTLGRPTTTRSPMSETAVPRAPAPFVRSPIASELHGPSISNDIESRFFHASDISRVEVETKKPEVRKPAAFFYADGQQEQQQRSKPSTRTTSPARSEKRSSGTRAGDNQVLTKSPPMLSPALSTLSSTTPFFTPASSIVGGKPRSPSPTKENIHLSYRKGASQIFGQRPSPIPSARTMQETERRPSFQRAFQAHRKSPSLSSIDSELTNRSRRRSHSAQDFQGSSPLREETSTIEQPASPTRENLSSIDTTIDGTVAESGTLSPTKAISELAADARRERKVLDLEISNSSLLAINSSLEREIRRQKSELKRFRRLSRAGRFSFDPLEARRGSSSLAMLEESADDFDADMAQFGPASGFSELYDDISSSDDESSVTSGDPAVNGDAKADRLAKDDRRLRADLEKHRELLVQSQMMNQSIRRCMYATEEMIKEGKKAIDYKVRVSDVKLGGRILTGHEEEDDDGNIVEEIEIEDEFDGLDLASPTSQDGVDNHAQSFMELWGGIGKTKTGEIGRSGLDDSETGDRDSGIEIDRLGRPLEVSTTTGAAQGLSIDSSI